jgi:hypothetical protein
LSRAAPKALSALQGGLRGHGIVLRLLIVLQRAARRLVDLLGAGKVGLGELDLRHGAGLLGIGGEERIARIHHIARAHLHQRLARRHLSTGLHEDIGHLPRIGQEHRRRERVIRRDLARGIGALVIIARIGLAQHDAGHLAVGQLHHARRQRRFMHRLLMEHRLAQQGQRGNRRHPRTGHHQITHLHRLGQSMTRVDHLMVLDDAMPARHLVCRHKFPVPQNRRMERRRPCLSICPICGQAHELNLSCRTGQSPACWGMRMTIR